MMGRRRVEWWCALLVLSLTASGRFVVEKNSLRVTSPPDLRGVYECAIGNFGMPPYGGTMHGVVVYPRANRKACKPFDDFGLSFKPRPGGLPVFLLVDRGGEGSSSVLEIRNPFPLPLATFKMSDSNLSATCAPPFHLSSYAATNAAHNPKMNNLRCCTF
jgi:hypothetical protein